MTPRGDPLDVPIDGVESGLPQRVAINDRVAVHTDEPLRGCQKDHRVVTPPAMRVLVLERLAMPQTAALLQRFFDLRVRVEYALAGKHFDRVQEPAARSDRRVNIQPVTLPRVEVIRAMPGRRVHRPGPRLERDVIAQHGERRTGIERMPETQPFELFPLHARDGCVKSAPRDLGDF